MVSKYRKQIKPSLKMWKYWGDQKITPLMVVSSIADKKAGYHISYSAHELLKDLSLLTPKGNLNKEAHDLIAIYLHYKFHANGHEAIEVIDPTLSNVGMGSSVNE